MASNAIPDALPQLFALAQDAGESTPSTAVTVVVP